MALTGGPERRVNQLMDRAIRLGQRGKTAQALAASAEALAIARQLAGADPHNQARHAPVLASLLYNMAALLASTGQRAGRSPVPEYVWGHLAIAKARPGQGGWAEALPLDARAISLYRRLTARGFEGLAGHLAAAEAALFIHAHAIGEPGVRFVREFASGSKHLYRELYAVGETLEADQKVFAELNAKYGGITPGPGNSEGPPAQ